MTEHDDLDDVQAFARRTVDTTVAEVVEAIRTVDLATVRQLAAVRVDGLDDLELTELLILAAVLVDDVARRNVGS